jgi:hypothetical protein
MPSTQQVGTNKIIDAVLHLHGWDDIEEMKRSDLYQRLHKEHAGDKEAILNDLSKREIVLRGWFINESPRLKRVGSEFERVGTDARILCEDGILRRIAADDVEIPSQLAKVAIEPAIASFSVKNPSAPMRIRVPKHATFEQQDHDVGFPKVGISSIVNNASKRGNKNDWNRGCLEGSAQGIFTGTTVAGKTFVDDGEGEYGGMPHVRVVVETFMEDDEGRSNPQEVSVKIPAAAIQDQLGFDVTTDDAQDIKDMVEGEPVLVNGDLGITMPVTIRDRDGEIEAPAGIEGPEAFLEFVRDPNNANLFTEPDDRGVRRLDLRGIDGNVPPHVEIGGLRVWDIEVKENEATFNVLAGDLDPPKPFWCNVRERTTKNGNIMNRGAFFSFLNFTTGQSSVSDAKKEAADALPDL